MQFWFLDRSDGHCLFSLRVTFGGFLISSISLLLCPSSPSNQNETESFMDATKAQNWVIEPQEKKNVYIHICSPRDG
jgi:hypothetical protein